MHVPPFLEVLHCGSRLHMQSAKYPEGGAVGPQDAFAVLMLTRKVHRPLEHHIVVLVM